MAGEEKPGIDSAENPIWLYPSVSKERVEG